MSQEAAPIRLLTAALPSGRTRTAAPQATGLPTPAAGPAGGQAGWSAAFPLIVLLTSVGTLAVAAAYAAGREGWPYLSALYWPGQLLVYVPIAVRAYSPRLTRPAEGFALLLLLFVQQTLLFRLYSPLELKFPDELQHWRGTVNVVQSGTLDQANYSLPVAVHYPGLEALGGAVSASTGLSVTATAFIVAALLHLLLACALYVLCLRIRADWRVATVACIVYAASPQYMVFDAMYIYQSLALPFLLLAVWALRVLRLPGRAAGRWAVLLISIGVVTVSHHLTSFVMVALLGSLTAAGLCRPRPGRELRPAAAWLVATAAVLAWVLLVARDVVGSARRQRDRIAARPARGDRARGGAPGGAGGRAAGHDRGAGHSGAPGGARQPGPVAGTPGRAVDAPADRRRLADLRGGRPARGGVGRR